MAVVKINIFKDGVIFIFMKMSFKKTRLEHPQLGIMFGGDSLFSRQPLIETILKKHAHYILVAKPTDHTYLMEWLAAYSELHHHDFTDKQGRLYHYEWMLIIRLCH